MYVVAPLIDGIGLDPKQAKKQMQNRDRGANSLIFVLLSNEVKIKDDTRHGCRCDVMHDGKQAG